MEVDRILGNRIRMLRERAGLTQRDMSAHTGLNLSLYRKIENGDALVHLERLRKISNALGVQVRDITDILEPMKTKTVGLER